LRLGGDTGEDASQQPPSTPTKQLTIRPALPPTPQKQAGTPLARDLMQRSLSRKVKDEQRNDKNIHNELEAAAG
jgi:hypothetical protein